MSALFPPTLRSQRQFVGTVDATRDSPRATARSLEQTQGGQRSSCAQIVPMGDEPVHPADALVVKASLCCLLALVAIFVCEWMRPEWFA